MKTDELIEHTVNKRTESQEEKPEAESIVEEWRINDDTVEYKTVMDDWCELGTYDEVRELDECDELDDVSEVRSVIEKQWRGDGKWNVEYQPVDKDGIDEAFVIPFSHPLEPVVVQPVFGDTVSENRREMLQENYDLLELESMDLTTEDGDNLVRKIETSTNENTGISLFSTESKEIKYETVYYSKDIQVIDRERIINIMNTYLQNLEDMNGAIKEKPSYRIGSRVGFKRIDARKFYTCFHTTPICILEDSPELPDPDEWRNAFNNNDKEFGERLYNEVDTHTFVTDAVKYDKEYDEQPREENVHRKKVVIKIRFL